MPTNYSAEVTQLYEDIQFRAPDSADLATYTALLTSGQLTLADVQQSVEADPYTQDYVNPVIREYQAAFGRLPDQAGLSYWVNEVAGNPTALAELSTIFANSAEFNTRYAANASTIGGAALVTALYENVLDRAPDATGLAYWVNQDLTAAQLLQAFAQSPEFVTDSAAAITAYENAEAAGAPPPDTESLFSLVQTSFTLTTGADNVSGYTNVTGDLTPYFYNGIGPTLNSDDKITNVENLTLTDQYGTGNDIIPAGAQLSNITNITLDTAGNAGGAGTPFDTSAVSGVKSVTVNSAGGGVDFVNVAQTTNVLDNQASAGGDAGVHVTGGASVTVISNGGDGVNVGGAGNGVSPASLAELPTGAVFITENGSGDGVSEVGGTSVNVSITSPTNDGDVQIGNTFDNTGDSSAASATATDPSGAITVTDASQEGGNVTIFGGTDVSVTAAGDYVTVGDWSVTNTSNEPTGNVTISDTAHTLWSDLGGDENDVSVYGGVNVNVTTNTGDVFVGGAVPGSSPSGTVTITDTATNDQAEVGVYGGTNVTINGAHTVSALDIQVGEVSNGVTVAPSGNVTIYDNAAKAWSGDGGPTDVGVGHLIDVIGGANVNITTNTATVVVGGHYVYDNGIYGPEVNATNTGFIAGQEPTGNVTIVDTATAEDNDANETALTSGLSDAEIDVYGGVNVSITASGIDVNVGYDTGGLVSAPSGTVTVSDLGAVAYDLLTNDFNESVDIIGGTNVSVTTNSGGVWIGEDRALPSAGSEPSGTITVNNESSGYVDVYGGTNVTVTSAGGDVQVGDGANSADKHSPLTNPTGTVNVTDSAVETGGIWDSTVKVEGGTAVTVNTTGGDVLVGTNWAGDGATPVTGAVVVNDTFGGLASDNIHVMGGTTVNLTESASHHNSIDVGTPDVLNLTGSALATSGNDSTADDPTGDVTIVDETVNGAVTTYGKESFSVVTNGAKNVSITGGSGHGNLIEDVQSTVLASGVAAGTSTLANVTLTGVNGITEIVSDALTNLSVASAAWFTGDISNDTASSSLTLNLSNDSQVQIVDEGGNYTGEHDWGGAETAISSITVNVSGTPIGAFPGTPTQISLDLPNATSVTFNDASNAVLADNWPGTNLESVAKITATGAGSLGLGDLSGLATLKMIDASAATGGVTVELNPGVTSFKGDGNDVVLITQPGQDFGVGVTLNGGGGSTIYVDFNGDAGTDLPLGNVGFGAFQGFSSFGVVDANGSYNVEGFSTLLVGGAYEGLESVNGAITFENVGQGAALDVIDPDGTITYALQTPFAHGGPLNLTVGQDFATFVTNATIDVSQAMTGASNDITSLTVNAQGFSDSVNVVNAALTSVTIKGDASLDLVTGTDNVDTNAATGDGDTNTFAAVTSINASGSSGEVNVFGVTLGSHVTVTGGSGQIFAEGVFNNASAVDTYNLGSGGGGIIVGSGGAGYAAGTGTATGSEMVNLTANAPVGTIIEASPNVDGADDGAFAIVSNWNHGTVGSGTTGDAIELTSSAVIIGNTAPNAVDVETFGQYVVSGGVISLATGSPVPSSSQELSDAQKIVDAAATGTVALVTVDISTGHGTQPATFVIQNEGGGAKDVFVELTGVSGQTGFGALTDAANPADPGNLGAGTSVSLATADVGAVFANLTAANGGSGVVSTTYTDTGETIDTVTASVKGVTNTYAGLNNFAVLTTDTGGGSGNVVVTQVGANPILTLTASGETELNNVTYGNSSVAGDDPTLALYADGGSIVIDGSLIDASNTGTSVVIFGDNSVSVAGFTDTALKTINASELSADLTLTAAQNGLSITGTSDSSGANDITANGTGDTITVGTAPLFGPSSSQDFNITANGKGDTLNLNGGSGDVGATGTGDTFNVTNAHDTVYLTGNGDSFSTDATQLGSGDTLNVSGSTVHAWLGANSTLNLSNDATADVHVVGDTAGASLTNMTTINLGTGDTLRLHMDDFLAGNVSAGVDEHWAANGDTTDYGFNSTNIANSQVNVASATSLAQALNIAASESVRMDLANGGHGGSTVLFGAAVENAHTALVDWFQYGGNTYLVESINSTGLDAAHTGLESGDIVVKFVGLVDLSHDVDVVLNHHY